VRRRHSLTGSIGGLAFLLAISAGVAPAEPSCATICLVPATLPSGTVDTAYSTDLKTATVGGTAPYSYASAVLPPGLAVSSTGLITGTPTTATSGVFAGSVTITDSSMPSQTVTAALFMQVFPQPLTITTNSLFPGVAAVPYSQPIQVAGGAPPYTWSLFRSSLTGTGLALSGSTGIVSGIPAATGAVSFRVEVTDTAGSFAFQTLTIQVYSQLAISTPSALHFAVMGQPYSMLLATQPGTGGPSAVTWSAAPGTLPAGLTLDSTGLLHGTPSSSGTFNFAIQATDGISPAVLNATMNIYGPLSITTTKLPSGASQQSYGPVMLAANGGSGSVTWSQTGLPAMLALSAAGVISGAANKDGSYPVTVSVTDRVSGQTASQSFTLVIYAPISIATPAPAGVAAGGSVSVNLSASGGLPPYVWSAVGTPPAGFSVSGSGVVTGTALPAGNFGIQVQVTDAQPVSAATTVNVNVLGLLTTSPLPDGSTVSAYSAAFSAIGGSPPYTFSASGLPAGLTLSSGGFLTGAVKQAGTSSFSVQVMDKAGISASGTYSLTFDVPGPLTISAASPADGTVKVAYSASLAATGGNPPYVWSIQSGALPAGISMSSTGVFSGTPTAVGSASFIVQATDGSGASVSASATIKVDPPPLKFTTLSPLPSGLVGTDYPQQVLGVTGGVSPYTFSLTDGSLSGLTLTNGVIGGIPTTMGDFSATITVQDSVAATAQTTLALHVRAAGTDLVLANGSLSFSLLSGATAVPQAQYVSVASSNVAQTIDFSVQTSPGASWVTASAGSATPTTLTVGLTGAALSLAPSTTPYTATVTLTCTSAACNNLSQTVAVSLTVGTAPGVLTAVTDLLSFSSTSATPAPSAQPLVIQNSGGGSLGFQSVVCEASWCTVGNPPAFLSSGSSASISVTVDPTGLPAGYYRTTVDIASSGGKASIPVALFVAQSAEMTLAPAGAQIQMLAGGTPGNLNGSFLVSVAGDASLSWTATASSTPGWLILNTTSGASTGTAPGVISFSIDPTVTPSLSAQPYYGTIQVTSPGAVNSTQNFEVVLNVETPDTPVTPDAQPAGLFFLAETGTAAPPQTVQVFASSSMPLGYQASATTTDGAAWLSVNPATGGVASSTAPGQSSVSVDASKLAPGIYYGGINYSLSSYAVRTVNVTLVVESPVAAPASNSTGVHPNTTAPACTPSALAPTQTGLVNNFSTPASWPTPLAIQLMNDCGKAVSSGQIVVTFTNGDPPLALGLANSNTGLYSGTWTPRNAGSQVSLNARATAPGLAAANLQISGTVVPNVAPVLNANGTLHVFNPQVGAALAPGTIVQIYGSGLASGIAGASTIPLPTSLNGASVIIGGVRAPLYFVSPGQINAQIPFELTPGQEYQVIANANGALTTPTTIQLAPVTPGLATYADGAVIAQHVADGTLINDASPAKPGEYVVAYLAGLGATTVDVPTGAGAPSDPLAHASVTPSLTLNGVPAPVLFGGLTPGLVGLYQMDFQIPADTPDGTLTLVVTQSTFGSNVTTLPVHQ
jgi:uncharacterized protein (TIGR03437 family)